jgi:hypothetical protein
MEDEVVQILHHSFTKFLLDDARTGRSSPELPQFPVIESISAHRDIAMMSLDLLKNGAFDAYPADKPNSTPFSSSLKAYFRTLFLQNPLVEYAGKNWPYHVRE